MHSEGLTESWNHLLFWTLLYNNIRTLTWPGTYVSTYAWNGGDVFFFFLILYTDRGSPGRSQERVYYQKLYRCRYNSQRTKITNCHACLQISVDRAWSDLPVWVQPGRCRVSIFPIPLGTTKHHFTFRDRRPKGRRKRNACLFGSCRTCLNHLDL